MSNRKRRSNISRSGSKLKREGKNTGRALLGLTPLGPGLTMHDVATKTPRLIKAISEFGDEFVKEAKRQVRKRNPFS